MFLINEDGKIADELKWTDSRDLSEKLLEKIDKLLKRNNLAAENISGSDFYCDSPYFRKSTRNKNFCSPLYNKDLFSKGKCGFTAWQTGEITAKVLNFIIKTNY